MENERSKEKKKIGKNFLWAAVLLFTLLFTSLGILFYLLVPGIQLSPVIEKLLLSVVLILLLIALFAWKFWYKDAFKKYVEEHVLTNFFDKEAKMVRHRTFILGLSLLIFLGIGIGWYFGHHRPTQERLNLEPVRIYKAVEPLKTKTQSANTHSTTTSTHAQEEDASITVPASDTENTNTFSSPEQSDSPDNTELSRNTLVSQEKEEAGHKHTQSEAEQEALKKLLTETEKTLESAKQMQKEGLGMMREAMPIVANHLNTLSTEEQIKMLRRLKTTMLNQISQYPPEFQSLIEEHNVIEEGWKMYLDMLAETGYTPPRNFE